MTQVRFFATETDIVPLMRAIEATRRIRYVSMGNESAPAFPEYRCVQDLPGIGLADKETGSVCRGYIIVSEERACAVRQVRSTSGNVRYCMDQLANPETVVFRPAGVWSSGILLAGEIGTAHESEFALNVLEQFKSSARKTFVRVRSHWIGSVAYEMALRGGYRLTFSAQSPSEYDFRVSELP